MLNERMLNTTEVDPVSHFKQKLDQILYTQVTVDNIKVFADAALADLIKLNESVIEYYQDKNPDVEISGAALEDQAYAAYRLDDIDEILTRITATQEQIKRVEFAVNNSLENIHVVITPPSDEPTPFSGEHSGTYEAPTVTNRLITLAYILEKDFDITTTDTTYTKGITNGDMVREEPYVRVEVPFLERLVYICDESGNASYIFNTSILNMLEISVTDIDKMTKNQRNAFLRITPSAGQRIIQSPKWRQTVSQALSESFSDEEMTVSIDATEQRKSEFSGKNEFLEFPDFLKEVKEAYIEAGSPSHIQGWYVNEYKKRNGKWPASPSKKYYNIGWQGDSEMVGLEAVKFLEFPDFLEEVRIAYTKAGSPRNTLVWYNDEYKKHFGWPSTPHATYKGSGFETYAEITGKKVELLDYADFLTAVRKAYVEAGSPSQTHAWYNGEYKRHPGWSSTPQIIYKGSGFKNYAEMTGKKIVEFLDYADFITAVKKTYVEAGSPSQTQAWYKGEYKKHSGWPSTPQVTYKSSGFETYAEMTGKKIVEFLDYADFLTAIKKTYVEAGSPSQTQAWYNGEYKKHSGWPSTPQIIYKSSGFETYAEMTGKKIVEFLDYADFVTAIREAYVEAGSPRNIQAWYNGEYKKHSGWPSTPNKTYTKQGWKGLGNIVDGDYKAHRL